MQVKRSLIIGINGQDGSYLAERLVDLGHDVHGVIRRSSHPNLWRLSNVLDKVTLHQGDLLDPVGLKTIIERLQPDTIYNEADQDHVGYSVDTPGYSALVTFTAVSNLLDMLRGLKHIKLFIPLSATMFGNAPAPQSLSTPFNPQSPYAVSKVALYHLCKLYRERHGVKVSTAILYNHDSVRRQGDYLLHKICKRAAQILRCPDKTLVLTNPEMRVDIGWAEEFVYGFERLMCLDPTDVVIGTGRGTSIRELVKIAFNHIGVAESSFKPVLTEDPIHELIADESQCLEVLRWAPTNLVSNLVRILAGKYKSSPSEELFA